MSDSFTNDSKTSDKKIIKVSSEKLPNIESTSTKKKPSNPIAGPSSGTTTTKGVVHDQGTTSKSSSTKSHKSVVSIISDNNATADTISSSNSNSTSCALNGFQHPHHHHKQHTTILKQQSSSTPPSNTSVIINQPHSPTSWIEQIQFKAQYYHFRCNDYVSVINSARSLDKVEGLGATATTTGLQKIGQQHEQQQQLLQKQEKISSKPETTSKASSSSVSNLPITNSNNNNHPALFCWNFPRVKLRRLFNAKSLDDILDKDQQHQHQQELQRGGGSSKPNSAPTRKEIHNKNSETEVEVGNIIETSEVNNSAVEDNNKILFVSGSINGDGANSARPGPSNIESTTCSSSSKKKSAQIAAGSISTCSQQANLNTSKLKPSSSSSSSENGTGGIGGGINNKSNRSTNVGPTIAAVAVHKKEESSTTSQCDNSSSNKQKNTAAVSIINAKSDSYINRVTLSSTVIENISAGNETAFVGVPCCGSIINYFNTNSNRNSVDNLDLVTSANNKEEIKPRVVVKKRITFGNSINKITPLDSPYDNDNENIGESYMNDTMMASIRASANSCVSANENSAIIKPTLVKTSLSYLQKPMTIAPAAGTNYEAQQQVAQDYNYGKNDDATRFQEVTSNNIKPNLPSKVTVYKKYHADCVATPVSKENLPIPLKYGIVGAKGPGGTGSKRKEPNQQQGVSKDAQQLEPASRIAAARISQVVKGPLSSTSLKPGYSNLSFESSNSRIAAVESTVDVVDRTTSTNNNSNRGVIPERAMLSHHICTTNNISNNSSMGSGISRNIYSHHTATTATTGTTTTTNGTKSTEQIFEIRNVRHNNSDLQSPQYVKKITHLFNSKINGSNSNSNNISCVSNGHTSSTNFRNLHHHNIQVSSNNANANGTSEHANNTYDILRSNSRSSPTNANTNTTTSELQSPQYVKKITHLFNSKISSSSIGSDNSINDSTSLFRPGLRKSDQSPYIVYQGVNVKKSQAELNLFEKYKDTPDDITTDTTTPTTTTTKSSSRIIDHLIPVPEAPTPTPAPKQTEIAMAPTLESNNAQNKVNGNTVTMPVSSDEKNGKYFLCEIEKEKSKIQKLIEKATEDLEKLDPSSDESGRVRAAIGKAKLLITKKFKQFEGLCETNMKEQVHGASGEEPKTQNDDLAGFWDMVMIQVTQIHLMFRQLDPNNQENNENVTDSPYQRPSPAVKATRKTPSTVSGSPTTSTPKQKPGAPSAALNSARDESRRKLLAERRKAMKNQMTAAAGCNGSGSGAVEPDIQIFVPESQ